jgi:uncharacterized protein YgiM (DUF1202 family)
MTRDPKNSMAKSAILMVILALFTAACAPETPAATLAVPSSPTIVVTATPSPSEVPATHTFTPTPPVFSGTLTMQVNVRSGPGTGYESLGLLNSGEKVQVNLQSGDGQWYRILYSPASEGSGWVAAQYVAFAASTPFFPTAPGPRFPTGRVLQRLNIRSGPGRSFETLGTLEAGAVVSLVAKNATATWFQIVHPAGTAQRGWVTAQYIQTESSANLPVVDAYGNPAGTGTPGVTSIPMTPTPTVGPAPEDGDSSVRPVARVSFSAGGTRRLTYSSQVSAPDGDGGDWLEFTPYASLPGADASLRFSLECAGNGTLVVKLFQAGAPLPTLDSLSCGSRNMYLTLPAGLAYQVFISVKPEAGLRLVQYRLSIENLP